jgi:hypothetical protein
MTPGDTAAVPGRLVVPGRLLLAVAGREAWGDRLLVFPE